MTRMTATDVARNFSAVVNRVGEGERIEIVRNGATVAELRPPSRVGGLEGEEWRRFVAGLPVVDAEFTHDVIAARSKVGFPVGRWPAG
jgi:antitoxin (DNA-binding transcriptional repressor) of toxin-antitoxin stability system